MKFLLDANLPFKLAFWLRNNGYDVLHTDELPNKERTKDKEIREISNNQNRIVITKDSDFLDSHLLIGIPKKLLLISTGNISNKSLLKIFEDNFANTVKLFQTYSLIEITNEQILAHEL